MQYVIYFRLCSSGYRHVCQPMIGQGKATAVRRILTHQDGSTRDEVLCLGMSCWFCAIVCKTALLFSDLLPLHNSAIIFRPHRSTRYVDAAYFYRPSSVVCHTSEPCKNGCTDRAAVWVEDLGRPGDHVLDGGPDPPWEGANFWG